MDILQARRYLLFYNISDLLKFKILSLHSLAFTINKNKIIQWILYAVAFICGLDCWRKCSSQLKGPNSVRCAMKWWEWTGKDWTQGLFQTSFHSFLESFLYKTAANLCWNATATMEIISYFLLSAFILWFPFSLLDWRCEHEWITMRAYLQLRKQKTTGLTLHERFLLVATCISHHWNGRKNRSTFKEPVCRPCCWEHDCIWHCGIGGTEFPFCFSLPGAFELSSVAYCIVGRP